MSDPTDQVPQPSAPAGQPGASRQPGDGSDPENARGDWPQEAKEEIASLTKRVQDQSAMLGRLDRTVKDLQSQLTKAPSEVPIPTKPTPQDGIAERHSKLEAFQESLKSKARLSSLRSALMENGVPESHSARVAKMIDMENRERFVVTEDEFGGFEVGFQDNPETVVRIGDWVKAVLQTDEYRMFLPAKPAPSTRGIPGSRGGSGRLTVTTAELAAGKVPLEDIIRNKVDVSD